MVAFLCCAASATRADLEQLSRRGDDGTTYQVLRFTRDPAYGDAEKFRVTTVAASVFGIAGCASGGGTTGKNISAAVGVLPALQALHPFASVARTAVVTPNDPTMVAFDSRGAGTLSLGSGAAAITVCRVPEDCGGTGVPLVSLSTNDPVGPACLPNAGLFARCNGGFLDLQAYAFGPSTGGSPPTCDFTPTVNSTVCAPQPSDGFDLQDGQAIVFVYDDTLCGYSFATAAGGFGIDTDGTNAAQCGAGQIVTAQVWTPVLEPPPLQSPAACEQTPTPTPTTIIIDHPTPTSSATHASTPTATATPTLTSTALTPTSTATVTPTSCVSSPPLVNPVTSPTDMLQQTITGYSPGLFCFRGGHIEISGVEVLSLTTNCTQGTFEATVRLQPDQTNHVMVCLLPGLCGTGGCVTVEIVHASQPPAATPTLTPTATPTVCTELPPPTLHFGLSVEPDRPVVGDPVVLTFSVSGNGGLPEYSLSGADPILEGDTSPIRVSGPLGQVTYHLVAAQPGSATLVLDVNYEAAFGCAEQPIYQFINASSQPFTVTVICSGDCAGDGVVTVDELIKLVNIALGDTDVSNCAAGDVDGNGTISIAELVTAVNHVLNGCTPNGLVAGDAVGVPDDTVRVPLTVQLDRGTSLATLRFVLTVVPLDPNPALSSPVAFEPSAALQPPDDDTTVGNETVTVGWLTAFDPPLAGSVELGVLHVPLPTGAHAGGTQYRVAVHHVIATDPTASLVPVAGESGVITHCSVLFYGRVLDCSSSTPIPGAFVCLGPQHAPCVRSDAGGAYDGLCYQGQSSAGAFACASRDGTFAQAYDPGVCAGPFTPSGTRVEANLCPARAATPTPTSTRTSTATPTPSATATCTCSQSNAAQAEASPSPARGGDTVTLDASASHGTVLSYRWTQVSGPPVEILPDATSVRVHFLAPDVQSTTTVRFSLYITLPTGGPCDCGYSFTSIDVTIVPAGMTRPP